jgi:hypothetical protein
VRDVVRDVVRLVVQSLESVMCRLFLRMFVPVILYGTVFVPCRLIVKERVGEEHLPLIHICRKPDKG